MKRPTAPKEAKVELINEVLGLLEARHVRSPESAILYLLNYFTTFDLISIRDELREMNKRDGKIKDSS